MRKHLKPATPAWIMGRISSCEQTVFIYVQHLLETHPDVLDSTWFPGITPPQKAVSTKHFPVASRSFSLKLSRVVVGGMLFLILENSYILFKIKTIQFTPHSPITHLLDRNKPGELSLKML